MSMTAWMATMKLYFAAFSIVLFDRISVSDRPAYSRRLFRASRISSERVFSLSMFNALYLSFMRIPNRGVSVFVWGGDQNISSMSFPGTRIGSLHLLKTGAAPLLHRIESLPAHN